MEGEGGGQEVWPYCDGKNITGWRINTGGPETWTHNRGVGVLGSVLYVYLYGNVLQDTHIHYCCIINHLTYWILCFIFTVARLRRREIQSLRGHETDPIAFFSNLKLETFNYVYIYIYIHY